MAQNLQIFTKGESVYACDVCKRKVRVPTNKYSFDVVQRCIITYACQGKLHKVTLAQEKNNTPSVPPAVEGLRDWFQRRVLYIHEQPISAVTWVIEHNLANKPIVQAFADRNGELIEISPKAVRVIDLNTIEVDFDIPESGTAQCIALSSANITNPGSGNEVIEEEVVLLTNNGEITIATLDDTALVDFDVVYRSLSTEDTTPVTYDDVDDNPSINSAWVGSNRVFIAGKTYLVRSFNLLTHLNAPVAFASGDIQNGAPFFFEDVTTPGQVLILLANSPFSPVDRISNQYIDVGSVNQAAPELFYSEGEAFAQPQIIKKLYPPVFVVD